MKKIVDQQSPIVEKNPEQLRTNIYPPLSHFHLLLFDTPCRKRSVGIHCMVQERPVLTF